MKDPILAKRILPNNGHIVVQGGLHYIKGNKLPYFSLTATEYERGRDVCGGAMHERIVELFPQFKDLVAMHLSDIRGVPMHAVGNGWYFARGGQFLGQRWMPVNEGCAFEENLEKCQASLCRLLRITWEEAEPLMALGQVWRNGMIAAEETSKAVFVGLVKDMEPRWKAEAEACIAKHGLVVYGDAWLEPVSEEDGAGYDGKLAVGEG